MKKVFYILVPAFVATLVIAGLVLNGPALAQDRGPSAPMDITTFTADPSSQYTTNNVDWVIKFTDDGGYTSATDNIALCFYYPSGESGWATNFAAVTPTIGTGDTYTLVNSDNCPSITGYASIWYYATATNGFFALGQETFTWNNVVVPTVAAGLKGFSARAYTGTDCNGDAGTGDDYPGGLNCGDAMGVGDSLTFEVLADPSTVYASDALCGTYGTLDKDCFTSLDTALTKANGWGSTTVTIAGDLTLDANGSEATNTSPSVINGVSSAKLNAPGSCTGNANNAMLDIQSTSGVTTIQDITFDGSLCTLNSTLYGLRIGKAGVTASNLTVQYYDGTSNAGVLLAAASTLQNSTISNNTVGVESSGSTISGNTISSNSSHGIQVTGGTPSVTSNTISSNGGDGINSNQTGGTFQDNDITGNTGDGIEVPAGFTGTIQENVITNNAGYGVNTSSAATADARTIKYNNITGNTTGAFSNGNSSVWIGGNYLGDGANTADLGGWDGALVSSPFLTSSPGINTGNIYTGNGSANCGANCGITITGTTTPVVIIDLGLDTPWGLGIDPDQGTQCSNYFDAYVDEPVSTGTATIRLPVNPGACQAAGGPVDDHCDGARGSPLRYANSDSTVWTNTSNVVCENPKGNTQTWAQGDIDATLLGGTGVALMGSTSPTLIGLSSLTASAARNTWLPVAVAMIALVGVGAITIARRKRL